MNGNPNQFPNRNYDLRCDDAAGSDHITDLPAITASDAIVKKHADDIQAITDEAQGAMAIAKQECAEITLALSKTQKVLEKAKAECMIDPLTGCFNKKYLTQEVFEKFDPNRDDNTIGFVFADIDNLKFINDTFGHDIGDKAIVQVAEMLKSTFRTGEDIIRIQGDEFIIVCHNYNQTRKFENGLRKKPISYDINLELDYEHTYMGSFSLGAAVYNRETDTDLCATFNRADREMTKNKQRANIGRDSVSSLKTDGAKGMPQLVDSTNIK